MRKTILALLISAGVACGCYAHAANTEALGTRATILDPRFEAASFRHLDQLFPSHKISRSGPVSEIPRARTQFGPVNYKWKGKQHSLEDLLARTNTAGFLVIKDGRIVMERYFGGANDTSTFTSWSVGKSFTSTLIGLAIADGKIASVNDPVTKYLPELKGSGYDGAPIKAILQMSSGVKFNEEYTNTESDVNRMWVQSMVRNTTTLNDFLKTIPKEEPPGTKFVYRSADTQVLGWLVKRVTGETLADNLTRRIWGPMGMEHDATWLTDRPRPDAMEAAFCCINATLRDYARFGLIFLNKGMWNGKQLVPASWVEEATVAQSPQVQPGKLYPGDPQGYGYQWWTFPGRDRAFSAEGICFQFIYVNPGRNLVIAKSSAFGQTWDDQLELEQFAAFHAIAEASKNHR